MGKERSNNDSPCRLVLKIVKGILLNPIVAMSLLGLGGNFLFSQHVPTVLGGFLKVGFFFKVNFFFF